MRVTLYIVDNRSTLRGIWERVFWGVNGITVTNLGVPQLIDTVAVDAELLPSSYAHNRYGGQLKLGSSQVLRAPENIRGPAWIVTTPPFPGRLQASPLPGGGKEWLVVPEVPRDSVDETYLTFKLVFECVTSTRESNGEQLIRSLVADFELLNVPLAQAENEAWAVRRAYEEQFGLTA